MLTLNLLHVLARGSIYCHLERADPATLITLVRGPHLARCAIAGYGVHLVQGWTVPLARQQRSDPPNGSPLSTDDLLHSVIIACSLTRGYKLIAS